MAVNWQTGEQWLVSGEKCFLAQDGVSFEYQSGDGYPGQGDVFHSDDGTVYVSNIRILYRASIPSMHFKSFECPLQNLKDGKFQQGWFSYSSYQAEALPLPNGGLKLPGIVKFTFKNKGGFEFNSIYKQLLSRITGQAGPSDLEPLPLYEEPDLTTVAGPSSTLSNNDDQPPQYQ